MKKYLLDTSPLAAYLQQREPAVRIIKPLIERHEVTTSIIVYAEVTEYIKGLSRFPQRHNELRQLLREIYPCFLTYVIFRTLCRYSANATSPTWKRTYRRYDTLIAATAIERNLTIITTNHDFERVSHLKIKLVSLKAA